MAGRARSNSVNPSLPNTPPSVKGKPEPGPPQLVPHWHQTVPQVSQKTPAAGLAVEPDGAGWPRRCLGSSSAHGPLSKGCAGRTQRGPSSRNQGPCSPPVWACHTQSSLPSPRRTVTTRVRQRNQTRAFSDAWDSTRFILQRVRFPFMILSVRNISWTRCGLRRQGQKTCR